MLKNLKLLKNDMEEKKWVVSSFIFTYKSIEYIVLVHLFDNENRKKNAYALVLLEFLKKDDLKHALKVEANSNGLLLGAKELRNYFEIEYGSNLGDILSQFTDVLNKFIPKTVDEEPSEEQKEAMSFSLSISDSEDPKKKYCFGVKRNPKGSSRSSFNDNKTRLLRPDLYKYFKDDKTISFCYSSEIQAEKTDSEIMEVFSKKSSSQNS